MNVFDTKGVQDVKFKTAVKEEYPRVEAFGIFVLRMMIDLATIAAVSDDADVVDDVFEAVDLVAAVSEDTV